jgi:MYXO-CTERM domain-containing protein
MRLQRCVLAVCAGMICTAASAQITSINSQVIGTRYFNDIPGSTLVTVNNYPALTSFTESFNGATQGVNRHIGALSNNSTDPYRALPAESWEFSVTVRISGPAAREGGIHVGKLGTVSPYNVGALTGQLTAIADNGEIACFGAWLPFFSNNQPQYASFPRAARDTDIKMKMIYDASDFSYTYIINDAFSTGKLFMDAGAINFLQTAGEQSIGVYGQLGPTATAQNGVVTFTNYSVVPAPGAMGALALFGLAGIARRRR